MQYILLCTREQSLLSLAQLVNSLIKWKLTECHNIFPFCILFPLFHMSLFPNPSRIPVMQPHYNFTKWVWVGIILVGISSTVIELWPGAMLGKKHRGTGRFMWPTLVVGDLVSHYSTNEMWWFRGYNNVTQQLRCDDLVAVFIFVTCSFWHEYILVMIC